MTNQDVLTFQGGLIGVSNIAGIKFAYAISKNKMRVKHYLQDRDSEINKVIDISAYRKAIKSREDKRIKLCNKHCIKDSEGNPILKPDSNNRPSYQFENHEEFTNILREELEKEDEVINEIDSQKRELIQEWSEKKSTLDVYSLNESHLPDALNATQIEGIIWMIPELVEELLETSSNKENQK